MDKKEYIKKRSLCLHRKSKTGYAIKACAVLRGIKGIKNAKPVSNHRIKLSYSLEYLTYELVEGLLKELGFDLDNSIPAQLRRYYYHYMEDNARESLLINDQKHELSCSVEPNQTREPEQYWDEYH